MWILKLLLNHHGKELHLLDQGNLDSIPPLFRVENAWPDKRALPGDALRPYQRQMFLCACVHLLWREIFPSVTTKTLVKLIKLDMVKWFLLALKKDKGGTQEDA